jgi:subtilisin family serine protease
MRYLLGLLVVISTALQTGGQAVNPPQPYREAVVLVGFHSNVTAAQRVAILSATGGIAVKTIGAGTTVLYVGQAREQVAIKILKTYREVRYAEPDFIHRLAAGAMANDTYVGSQWAVLNERVTAAWSVTTGTNSVIVAVLDTGVQYTHPDLATNIWTNPGGIGGCPAGTHGYNVLTGICDPMDDDSVYGGHGTHVAGILGAVGNNAAGISGVNWTTSIMAVKWVDGSNTGYTSDLITAIDWVIRAKHAGINVRVVNDSATWAGTSASQALSDAIDLLGSNDILFVSAAGNTAQNNDTTPRYPCSYDRPNQICVGATDQTDHLWSSSNYGITAVKLGAPGVNIYSTLRQSNYGYISGGSMAAPQVSGTAALILSEGYQSVSALRSMILNNVDSLASLQGLVATGGRLNVCKAVPGCSASTVVPNNQALPVITGSVQVGSVVGVSAGVWSGLPTSYTYQWYRCTSSTSPCQSVQGATSPNYAIFAASDAGTCVAVAVTASNSAGASVAFSATSPPIASATSPFVISSTIQDSTTISGNVKWQATPSIASNFVQFYIDGVLVHTAISPYVYNGNTTGFLDTSTLGNRTHILGLRALSSDNRTYGFYGATVTVQSGPQNTSHPMISGTPTPGQILSTSSGSWTNFPSSFAYQWYRCDSSGSNCVSIAGANSTIYRVTASDAGFTLRAAVAATNSSGSTTATSAPTAVTSAGGGSSGGNGINLVQANAAHGGAMGFVSVSFSANNQAGNLIIAVVRISTTWQTVNVTDTRGNIYADAVNQAQSADGHQLHLFYAKNIAAGSNTVTATFSSTNNHPYLAIYEYAGLSTTSPLDQTAHAQGASSLPDTGSTAPTASASELVFAATGLPATYTGVVVSGSGYSLLQQDTGSERTATESALATSPGSIRGTFNLSPGTYWSVVVATFQAAGSPSSPPPPSSPAIKLVQSNAAHGSGVGSLSVSFPAPNHVGNLIIAVVRMSTTGQTVAIGDTAGNAYVEAASQTQTTDGHQLHLFYAKNIAGVVNTVTGTFSSTNSHPWAAIFEYSGLSTTHPLDQTSHVQGSGILADTGSTALTTSPNELIFAAGGFPTSYTGVAKAGTGYVLLQQDTTSERGATESMTTTSTGVFDGTFTLNPSTYWSAIVATFRP